MEVPKIRGIYLFEVPPIRKTYFGVQTGSSSLGKLVYVHVEFRIFGFM